MTLLLLSLLSTPIHAPAPADSTAVRQVRESLVAAFRAKNAAALGQILDSGVVFVRGTAGNYPHLLGRGTVVSFWAEAFRGMTGPNPLVYRTTQLSAGDQTAVDIGEFGPEGGPTVGRYVLVLRNESGWRVVYWNFFQAAKSS